MYSIVHEVVVLPPIYSHKSIRKELKQLSFDTEKLDCNYEDTSFVCRDVS